MADQLNMNGLSLGPDGQPQGPGAGRSYIPPHMRNRPAPAGPPMNAAPAGPAPGPAPGAGPGAGPAPGQGAPPGPPGPPMNGGIGNSNWAE